MRLGWLPAALGLAGFVLAPLATMAARIEVQPRGDGVAVVTVSGRLEQGDGTEFTAATLGLRRAVVLLSGEGGNLVARLEIGSTIRARGYATAVLGGELCASACAFAWLGGTPRHAADTARIGFHAAFVERGGRASVSGAGNALVGLYLGQLGFSPRAVVYLTHAPPRGMEWLSAERAQALGITVAPVPPALAGSGAATVSVEAGPAQTGPPAAPVAPDAPRIRQVYLLRGRSVPLPPGEWVEVWNAPLPAAAHGLAEAGAVLVRRSAAGIDAVILLHTVDRADGAMVADWGRSPVCTTHERLFLLATEVAPARQDCAQLDHVVLAGDGPPTPGWAAARAFILAEPGPAPQTFLAAAYRLAGGAAATTVTYLFATESFGFPASRTGWRDSPWHADHLDESRRRLVERFRAWLEANNPAVRAGILAGRGGALTRLP